MGSVHVCACLCDGVYYSYVLRRMAQQLRVYSSHTTALTRRANMSCTIFKWKITKSFYMGIRETLQATWVYVCSRSCVCVCAHKMREYMSVCVRWDLSGWKKTVMYHCAILKKTWRQFLLLNRIVCWNICSEKKISLPKCLDSAEFEENGDRMNFLWK